MMSEPELEGLYWMRQDPDREWEIGEWDGQYWLIIGYEVPFLHDADIVVGQRIEKPEK